MIGDGLKQPAFYAIYRIYHVELCSGRWPRAFMIGALDRVLACCSVAAVL